ncbi:MAG: hypothetical protein LBO09_07380 [Candidatus Peribacteria bacterium]|nr:hypothetical protein [Candidatus Peribacteria bacterium]
MGSNIQEILVQRIREYDIEDGLKLCERLQYTPYQYEQLLSSPPLQLKYSQLWGKIMDNI